MKTTGFLKLVLPETGDPADITQITEVLEKFENLHKDSVNFYNSTYTSGVITLTSNGGVYPSEYIDNLCVVWSSATNFKKGQTGIKIKIGNIARGIEINAEIMNDIKQGDFCFSKYYLSENKFKITSYYEELRKLETDLDALEKKYGSEKNNSISSTSSTTIATSKAVKTAYDKAVNAYNLAASCPYGVQDYYITSRSENPSTKWVGTTWSKIEGRTLIGASSTYKLGSTGGSKDIALSSGNIPTHKHSFSLTTNPVADHTHGLNKHRHKVDNHFHTQPQHKHRVTGGYGYDADRNDIKTKSDNRTAYAYTDLGGGDNTGAASPYTDYQTGGTVGAGGHSHTVNGSTGNYGSGSKFNILNPYLAVNIWRRVS